MSSTESFLSIFGFCYTFVTLYLVANILLFLNAALYEARLHNDFQKYVTAISRGCGATINLNMAVVLVVASRSLIGFLRETPLNMILPIDKAMPEFHRLVGKLLLTAGFVHSITHVATYIIKKPWSGGFSGATSLFISGIILLTLITAIRLVASPKFYQANYELFYRIHVGGGILALIAIVLHGLHYGSSRTWKWVLGPILIFIFDISLRFFREKRSYLLVSKHSAVFQGQDILKIRLPRVFHFQAGQYAELKVPELSLFQWHPFTIASAPHEPEMTFYIKAVGDWTGSLYELFRQRISIGGNDIEVHIRGPFGAATQHVGQFDHVILVGGGVGATPFCSVVKDAYNWITQWTPRGKKRKQEKKRGVIGQQQTNTMRASDEYPRIENSNDRIQNVQDSHIFTTNVCTEDLNSGDLDLLGNGFRLARNKATKRINPRGENSGDPLNALSTIARQTASATAINAGSLYTARDYLSSPGVPSTQSTPTQSPDDSLTVTQQNCGDRRNAQTRKVQTQAAKPQYGINSDSPYIPKRRHGTQGWSRPSTTVDDTGMGSYRDNSTGPHRRSLDYMTALYSAYSAEQANEVYQQSLDLMVGLSFGSVSLVRNVQRKKMQQSMLQDRSISLPMTVHKQDLSVLQNQGLMFLLFMRSVTINMILLWTLLLRFIIAGTALVFGGFRVFDQGLAIYKSPILTGIDLVLATIITLLVGIPSVIEVVELGSDLVHGFDLFVLTPIALFGVVVDIVALAKVGQEVHLFGVIHVFVIWPLLAILITIRLIRVIGERISQAERRTHTHSSTKTVAFYWTAPTEHDDGWLVSELQHYSDNKSVQLHRYLTRNEGVGTKTRTGVSLTTNFGRPDWTEILNETAEMSRNNSTIGVFFCGPHSMGAEVQDASMGAMRNSIVRGLHSGAVAMRGLEEVFGEAVSANEYTGETSEGGKSGGRGCNVKFVFKRESFA